MMKRKDILRVYEAGPEAVIALVERLLAQIVELNERVTKLEAQVSKNSSNSSKPPSSDGFKRKTKSLRERSGKPSGGQTGHPGSTLSFIETPTHTYRYSRECCDTCGHSLGSVDAGHFPEQRHVFDLPEIKLEVIEHLAERKVCPMCQSESVGQFPAEVSPAAVQYGSRIKALGVYLKNEDLLPYERVCKTLEAMCGHRLSEGTLDHAIRSCAKNLSGFEAVVKGHLKEADVLHHDETGLRVEKKLQWLHVASTAQLTWYAVHEKRGQIATATIGILPEFRGVLVHDHWKPYFAYACLHALCNAHHLRELKWVEENLKQAWASQMAKLLVEIKTSVMTCAESILPKHVASVFEARYRSILADGLKENPVPEKTLGQRGRQKKGVARNLVERLRDYQNDVLRFMLDFRVPFDNNQAERDVRMPKLHNKISGCFRSAEGAVAFCSIRSYLSTMRKQGINLLDALTQAIRGNPILPNFAPT